MQERRLCSESFVERPTSQPSTPKKEWSRRSLAESLSARLLDVGEVYQESEEELAAMRGRPVERVSGTRSVGIRLDDRMLSLRSRIADLLRSWAGLVVSERGIPASPGVDVPALLRFLGGQIPWLAEHAAGPDLDAELSALLDSSRSLLGPRVHQVSLGMCCHPGCTAPLRAVLSGAGGMAFSQVACDTGHTVPPGEWLLLSGRTQTAMNAGRQGGGA